MVSADPDAGRANQNSDFGRTGVLGSIRQRLEFGAGRPDPGGCTGDDFIRDLLETLDSRPDAGRGQIARQKLLKTCSLAF